MKSRTKEVAQRSATPFRTKTSRGFFFVLISFILIMYIFLYLAAWVNAVEISEKTASEKFRAAGIQGIVSELSGERFMNFFDISGNYALYRINAHASDIAHPMKYNSSDELFYLRDAFFSSVFEGKSDAFESENLSYSSFERETYTFGAWLNNLESVLKPAGLEVKSFEIHAENFTQVDHVTFAASMNVTIFVQDRLSTLSIDRTFHLEKKFNVSGFPDPMIKRETQKIFGTENATEKQIFFRGGISPSSVAPIKVANGSDGQGFFYGSMISAKDVSSSNPVESLRGQYILVGNFSEITGAYAYQQFGAYIITNGPGSERLDNCDSLSETETFMAITYSRSTGTSECKLSISWQTSVPFVVMPGFNMSEFSGPDGERRVLIIANSSVKDVSAALPNSVFQKRNGAAAYEIEKLRDATVCAYFISSGRAPSYAQRLSRGALSLNSTFGMEALLVGKWAGGSELPDYNNYSRVDFEFFSRIEGAKVRGMPGCKSLGMCSTGVGDNAPLGHFRLSGDSLEAYGIINENDISCGDGRAGCG